MSWSSYSFYEGVYWTSSVAMLLGFSLRIRGSQHVPQRGPVLFVSNHQSFFDPILIGLAARRHLSYLARKSLFANPFFAHMIRLLNAVPIEREGLGIEGLRTVLSLLQAGRAVTVFPEGERTPDGAVHPLQPGVQLLIKRAKAAIVPVGIAGAFEAWPRWRPVPIPAPLFLPPNPGTIALAVGQPLQPDWLRELPREEVLKTLQHAMEKVHQEAESLRRKT